MQNVRDASGHIVAQPFPFDEADKRRKEQKEAKINEILEKEKAMREFKASPVPSFSPNLIVFPKSVKQTTTVEPFRLESLPRHESYKENWHQKMKEEELLAKKNATFVARPCTVTSASPFQPERSSKPLTEPYVDLHSERRAAERREFDKWLKTREEEKLALERQREESDRRQEEIAIAELRASLVHKPLPLPFFVSAARNSLGLSAAAPKSPDVGAKQRPTSL